MANNDYIFPTTPSPSAIMPQREVNFADPTFTETTPPPNTVNPSIFKPVGISRPQNSSLSNADQSQDYDFSLFNQYVHYMPNPQGGVGLIDQTPMFLKSSIIYSRSATFQSYSPYG